MDYTEISYVQEGLGRFVSQLTISLMLNDIRVMPISSDPTREDSDGDEVLYVYDKNSLVPIDVFSACLNSDYEHFVLYCSFILRTANADIFHYSGYMAVIV